MLSNLLYQPNSSEETTLYHNDIVHDDLTLSEWTAVVNNIQEGTLSYATWYQDSDDELRVMEHYYTISNGNVKSYNQTLTD